MARPTTLPRWAETAGGAAATNIVEPNTGQKDTGYARREDNTDGRGTVPSSGGLNWLLHQIYLWLKWAGKGAPVDSDDLANKQYVDDHINDATAAHAASAISSTATGDVAATNVQAAIAELASEKATTTALTAETTRAEGVEGALDTRIDALEAEAPVDGTVTAGTNITIFATSTRLRKVGGIVSLQAGFSSEADGFLYQPVLYIPAGFRRSQSDSAFVVIPIWDSTAGAWTKGFLRDGGDVHPNCIELNGADRVNGHHYFLTTTWVAEA